jgi:Cof subfamily protein (haloacid dehalogenase superfamily)
VTIRLVATDLDGTVVRRDGTISERTAAAFAALEEHGIHLVLVTGRPPRWMAQVVDMTGHRGLAICANGALVYDLHTEQLVDQHLLDADTAQEVVRRVRTVLPDPAFAVERGPTPAEPNGFAHDPSYKVRWEPPGGSRIAAIEELLAEGPVAKLLVRDERSTSDAMLSAVRPNLAGLVEVTHSSPRDCLVEVSALGVSKATTLAAYAARLGILARDVVAFGDQPNDLAMLRWAGKSYAVANAHADVLDAVSDVTDHVDADGVAQVLEKLVAQVY